MIIVKKSGYLKYKNLKFRCAFGKNGIKKKTIEGDKITPIGIFKITKIYYRHDRISNLKTLIKKIKMPNKFNYEKLYRNDHTYDLLAVLNYNTNPVIKNKGSAIFIHVAKNNYKPTAGCVALKKSNLIKLLQTIKKNTKIKISPN
jgi:L,D-peptidoglycan transpeptidase YkuD (ErfK/YbiS/YcfS/YnhG family)